MTTKRNRTGLPPDEKELLREIAGRAVRLAPGLRLEWILKGLCLIAMASSPGVSRMDQLFARICDLEKLAKRSAKAKHPGYFAIDPDDEMIDLHNSAGPDPLTLRAASIVLPLLKAKKATPKMISVMLEEILKVRTELHSKKSRPDFIEYLRRIPSGPNVFDRIRALHSRMAPLPKGEAAKLIRLGRCPTAAGKRELRKRGYSPKSIASIQCGLAESAAEKTLYRGSFAKRRRKRVLLPEFKKLMSKKTVGNTQADLDAVRGYR